MKEIKIVPPNGYVVDTEKSTFEKIVLKPIDTKPRSWEEYCKLKKENFEHGYTIDDADTRIEKVEWKYVYDMSSWRNVLPSKELAEAFLAMMQLMSLRQEWIGNWKPDWNSSDAKFLIVYRYGKLYIDLLISISHPLSFPTKETAKEFLTCFKDLIEKAKYLL